MFKDFVLEGILFTALVAAITFGLGLVVRSALPSEAHAAEATVMEASQAQPQIVAVDAATSGWDVQLDSGVALHVEPRVADTGGAAPAVGQVQSFADQTCVLGACTGYAVFTDLRGTLYHGYRP
jgi:pectin methylesterase-like acyl-CoA thioesterase